MWMGRSQEFNASLIAPHRQNMYKTRRSIAPNGLAHHSSVSNRPGWCDSKWKPWADLLRAQQQWQTFQYAPGTGFCTFRYCSWPRSLLFHLRLYYFFFSVLLLLFSTIVLWWFVYLISSLREWEGVFSIYSRTVTKGRQQPQIVGKMLSDIELVMPWRQRFKDLMAVAR